MTPQFRLPPRLDVSTVAAVAVELRAALAAGDLLLDGEAVQDIDAAGIQLLCALFVSARKTQRMLLWEVMSPRIYACAETLGVYDTLDLLTAHVSGSE